MYYNYKGFFSIVLLALVDGDYKFLWADVGSNGSSSDCGIFNESELEPPLREGTLGFPDPEPFPNDDKSHAVLSGWGRRISSSPLHDQALRSTLPHSRRAHL